MKAFLAALTVFALVLCASVIHAICVSRITNRLYHMEGSFPKKEKEQNSPDPALQQAEEYWKTMQSRLAGTVNMRYLNAVTNALCNVIDYYEEGTVSDYEAARSLFREAVSALRISDTVDLSSVI